VRLLLDPGECCGAAAGAAEFGVFLTGGALAGLEADTERANAAHYAAGAGHVAVLQVRERDRDRDRETETETDRERQRQRDRERQRETERETDRDRDRDRERGGSHGRWKRPCLQTAHMSICY
jgi:hypothetical protein